MFVKGTFAYLKNSVTRPHLQHAVHYSFCSVKLQHWVVVTVRIKTKCRFCSFQAVDYESRSSYSFSVEVLNPIVDPRFLRRGPFKDRASIRVAVLDADEPPRFSRSRYLMDVSENCPPACTVGRVSAVDPDTGLTNNIRYSTRFFRIFNIQYLNVGYKTSFLLVKLWNEWHWLIRNREKVWLGFVCPGKTNEPLFFN